MRWFTLTGLRTVLSSPELRCETSGDPQKECGRTEAARPEPTGYLLFHVPENLVASSPCLQNRSGAASFPLPAPSLAAFHHCNLSILIHDGSRLAGENKNNPLKAEARKLKGKGSARVSETAAAAGHQPDGGAEIDAEFVTHRWERARTRAHTQVCVNICMGKCSHLLRYETLHYENP